ncbi:MAG: DeoR/GlpR family DNA-binding transcription regulator [Defluviitaleaceae bacterium]|nr:DeoR/GlpR family DNA-binding transcription regulator [Defluviitaleaceae bacterium]
MFVVERQQAIVEHLKKHKTATVTELAKAQFSSEATIRRDLENLQTQGLIVRTHGGAVLVEGLNRELPLYLREKEMRNEKRLIAELAAGLINEGDVIILDSSSTTHEMIRCIKKGLTVITNGAKTALSLNERRINVISTGGKLRENSLSFIGDIAESSVRNFCVNKLFFSCRAISEKHGLMDSSSEEAELRRVMMNQSQMNVLLCSADKFDKTALYRICDLNKIHVLVTDQRPPEALFEKMIEQNIRIITPDEDARRIL